ncbi:MAG: polysaccharide pyruvyl transferase family protein [Bacillota bacterium]|jgi:polysaccharide pyruvyl transferase CsaB
MIQAVIFGYFGQGNIGDETNLSELINLLREIDPGIYLTVISAAPAITAGEFDVATVGKYDFQAICHVLQTADFLIGGGGALFQDCTSLRSLGYYSFLVLWAKHFKTKVFLYGQGIGPLRSKLGKYLARLALAKIDLITVRDRVSIIALADLNVKIPELYFTAEPLLVKNQVAKQLVTGYWKRARSQKRYKIGLIFQATAIVKKSFWREFIIYLGWDTNVELYLLTLDRKDWELNQRLAALHDLEMLDRITSWEGLQAAIGGFDLVLSTRLHGLVAAVIQGVPCYGLAIDPKIDGFCLQWGIPFQVLTEDTEAISLGNKILCFLHQPLEKQLNWLSQMDFWRVRALENQALLKQFIQTSLPRPRRAQDYECKLSEDNFHPNVHDSLCQSQTLECKLPDGNFHPK